MKKNRILSNLLAAMAVIVALASVCILCMAISAPPILVGQTVAAVSRVEEMLSAMSCGNYEAVSGTLYGNPDLGSPPEEANSAEDLLWSAYLEGMEYEILGDCYAGDYGVAVDVKIRTLDIAGVVNGLGDSARMRLNDRMEIAENISELYDENNDFRQEIIAEVLQEAMAASLDENRIYQEETISLNLIFKQGEWWIIPNTELLAVLSGAVLD